MAQHAFCYERLDEQPLSTPIMLPPILWSAREVRQLVAVVTVKVVPAVCTSLGHVGCVAEAKQGDACARGEGQGDTH